MSINENNIPFFGDLGLPLQAGFEFRKAYKEHAYPLYSFDDKDPIDYWYDNPLYGRVDRFGNAIFLSESRLKQIKAAGSGTYFALDFVVDAFTGLQNYFSRAAITRAIDRDNSILTVMNPVEAWTSIIKKHHRLMKSLHRSFLTKHLATNVVAQENILTFDDFLKEFMFFMEKVLPKVPITRTGFISSNHASPLSSGLVIEIANHNQNTDIMKDVGFFQDPNYEFYKEATKRFGFFIDKNAPWRLTADITSTRMLKYMGRSHLNMTDDELRSRSIDPERWPNYSSYGVDPQTTGPTSIFNKYYYRSYVQDVDIFKVYILDMYNGFVSNYPHVKISDIRKRRTVGYTLHKRKFMTQQRLEEEYDSNFWIELYAKIRNFETDAKLDEDYFKRKIKRAKAINKSVDFYSALWYINKQFRVYAQVDILREREKEKQRPKKTTLTLGSEKSQITTSAGTTGGTTGTTGSGNMGSGYSG